MRITILTDRYAPEARAAAYLSRELAEGLARLGHDVLVITRMPTQFVPDTQPAGPPVAELVGGVKVKRVSAFTASPKIWLRALDQLIVSIKIMLVLFTAPESDVLLVYSPPLLLSAAAVVQRWVRRWPYILNLHDIYPQTAIDLGVLRNPVLIWFATMFESIVYRNAIRIVVAAPASKNILIGKKYLRSDSVEMIFNYIDTTVCAPGPLENDFRKRNGLDGRFVVLYAGLMGLAQDLTAVIEVARQRQCEPDWVFVFAGEGPCVSKWAAATKDLANVKMVGSLPYNQYYEALQAADVCLVVLSSTFKAPAVPGKVPTIMAAGRPIVASIPMGNDTREILDVARCGIAVLPDQPKDLLSALTTLKEHPERGRELGMNGRTFASTHYEVKGAVKKFERILREVNIGAGQQLATDEKAKHQEIG